MAEHVNGVLNECVHSVVVKIDHLLSFHKEGKWSI